MLLLRLVLGSLLVLRAGPGLWGHAPVYSVATSAFLAVSGLLLIAGLWVPLVGAVVGVIEITRALTMAADPSLGLMAGTVGAALALLGPGRWSVDARLFGWKRIEAPRRRSNPL